MKKHRPSAPTQLKRRVVLGGMGPGAPGFARAHPIADMGKLSLAHATHQITRVGALATRHGRRMILSCPAR